MRGISREVWLQARFKPALRPGETDVYMYCTHNNINLHSNDDNNNKNIKYDYSKNNSTNNDNYYYYSDKNTSNRKY